MYPAGGHPAVCVDVPVGGERAALADAERRAPRGAGAVALAVPAAARGRARAPHRRRPATHARAAHADGQSTLFSTSQQIQRGGYETQLSYSLVFLNK